MNGTPLVISEVIRRLCNDGVTTQAELARVAQVGESTVSRWAVDDGGPRFDQVCRWISEHPRLEARRAFRRCVPVADTPIEADINGDGRVDLEDVLDGAAMQVTNVAHMNTVIRTATKDGELNEQEAALVDAAAHNCIQLGRSLIAAADDSTTRRRKASPLKFPHHG